jgi:predicted dehydrogenase
VAVIGCGWWSTYTHIPGLKEYEHADLVALCDADEARLRAAAERYGVDKTYRSVDDLLAGERLDAAVVATYHATHYEVARKCLDAGLHVMIEKPMVLEAAQGRDLLERARARGREIVVGYPWHYTTIARRARELVTSGQLGPVQFVASLFASMVVEFYRGNPEAYRPVFQYPVTGPSRRTYSDASLAGGGQGHLQVTHAAGLLFFVTGLRAARVGAFMERFDVPVDLVDAISARFAPAGYPAGGGMAYPGAVGVVGSTGNIGVGDGGQHDLRVYCRDGYVLLDMAGGTLTVKRHDGAPSGLETAPSGLETAPSGLETAPPGLETAPEELGRLDPDDRYPRFATARNLVDVVLGRAPNGSPGEVGLRTVELLEAAYRSAAQGGAPVAVEDARVAP